MSIPTIKPYRMSSIASLGVNRVVWTPSAERCALLIHDMQRYFIDFFPTGAEPVTSLIANIAALRTRCQELGIPVIYSMQTGAQSLEERGLLMDFWGAGMGADPEVVRIVEPLVPAKQDLIILKRRYSAFHRTALLDELNSRHRDQLIVCGVYAHIGCLATALEAFMYDIQAFMVADAVADFSAAQHQMALNCVGQHCACVASTLDVVAALESSRRKIA